MKKTIIILSILMVLAGCTSSVSIRFKEDNEPADSVSERFEMPAVDDIRQNIRHYYLPNGLEILTIKNSASPMVCLNMTIRVGSAYEDYHSSGMSHMLEHLLFNGTETRTQEELYKDNDFYGIYSNAFTRKQYTDFFMVLPSQYLQEGMDIQSDMMFHSILPPDKLEKERGIVIEEIRKDMDSESYAVQNYFDRINFGSSGMGLPTLGTISTIENMPRDEVYQFYQRHYVPNNMILTVIGNFSEGDLEEQLEKYYGAAAPQPLGVNDPFELSANDSPRFFTNQTVLPVQLINGQIVYTLPDLDRASGDARVEMETGLEIYTEFVGEMLSKRLPDYSASLSVTDFPGNEKLMVNFSAAPGADITMVVSEITDVLLTMQKDLESLITAPKLALWVKQKEVGNISLLDSPHYYSMMQSGDLAVGGNYVLAKMATLKKITASDVVHRFQDILTSPVNVNLVFPESAAAADSSATEAVYAKSILPSGATLVTNTSSGSQMFGMHILIKNRSIIEGDLAGGAEILHSLLESGTDQYSGEAIKDQLAAIGAQTKYIDMSFIPYDDYYNSASWGYVRFECLEEDAEPGIRLLAHMLDRTILTDEKVEQGLSDARMRQMMKRHSGREEASVEFRKMFFGEDDPSTKSVSGNEESLAKINTAALKDLQQRYFRPENYIISISSGISHAELKRIFNSIWSQPAEPVLPMKNEISTDSEPLEKTIVLGKDQAQLRLGYKFEISEEDQPAFSLMTDILSDKMMFDLRETQGLAYSLGMSNGFQGDMGWLTASMGTGVANIDRALAGMKSYFSPSRLNEITTDDIRKTVNSNKGRYMMRNLKRIGQAFYLGYYEYLTGDYENAVKRNYQYDAVTVEEIRAVADKYLKLPENHTLLIVK